MDNYGQLCYFGVTRVAEETGEVNCGLDGMSCDGVLNF